MLFRSSCLFDLYVTFYTHAKNGYILFPERPSAVIYFGYALIYILPFRPQQIQNTQPVTMFRGTHLLSLLAAVSSVTRTRALCDGGRRRIAWHLLCLTDRSPGVLPDRKR